MQTRLRNTFLAGIFAVIPVAVTVFVIAYAERATRDLTRKLFGWDIPAVGIFLAIAAIYLAGLIVTSLIGRFFLRAVDRILLRVPLLKDGYAAWKQVSLTAGGREGMFARTVLVRSELGAGHVLGFTSADLIPGAAEPTVCVFLPNAPNPINGRLCFVPLSKLILIDLSAEEAFKLLLSTGNYIPAALGPRLPPEAPSRGASGIVQSALIGALIFLFLPTLAASAQAIRVGAAISLRDAIVQIAEKYEATGGGRVEFVFGSSGQIMAQIKNGAPIDLFISAANRQVDELERLHLVDPATRRVIAMNCLVLIAPADAKDHPDRFESLAGPGAGRIAMGEPQTVPAGQYAHQVLQSLKLIDAVSRKLVYGANVRQVLAYVERGEVWAGIVYATDAMQSGEKVRICATADPTTHEPIVYPAVIVAAGAKRQATTRFLEYMGQADAQAVLQRNGFALPKNGPATRP